MILKKYKINILGILFFLLLNILYQYPLVLVFAYFFNKRIFFFTDFLYTNSSLTFPLLMTLVLILIFIFAWKLGYLKNTLKDWDLKRIFWLMGIVFFTLTINYLVTVLVLKTQIISSVTSDTGMSDILGQLPILCQKYILGIIVPLSEELLFRSYIFGSITNKKVAFIISSVLFALVHKGFSWYLLPYLILSFIITWVYSKRNNFIESAIVHSSVNLLGGPAIKLLDTFFKLLPY
ncbi:hypothetical protein llh_13105 [Lactococcus cremoris subsp. cremoris A76]|uniref:CPBP family intramembrane glutamic endopeptidase n=1 Tax=Lactococcus lactis subsp. cremoris TaxID=1359 RepID=UPI000238CAE1|nr:type II CAAX endopeptidase family protein [Lactococcus cremoris]AEU41797.1 hypothetical protein llh_13105 [Lactococcus cremoris subsp. cremoris A76]